MSGEFPFIWYIIRWNVPSASTIKVYHKNILLLLFLQNVLRSFSKLKLFVCCFVVVCLSANLLERHAYAYYIYDNWCHCVCDYYLIIVTHEKLPELHREIRVKSYCRVSFYVATISRLSLGSYLVASLALVYSLRTHI